MTLLAEKKILEYEDIDSLPDGFYEIIDGERKDMSPSGFLHGLIEGSLSEILKENLSKTGSVATGEIGILIQKNPLRVRGADIVYITKESYPKPPIGILEKAPELAVEILSPANTTTEMNGKLKDYLAIGIPHIVYVDPENEMTTVYENNSFQVFSFEEKFRLFDFEIKMSDLLV
ncbi:MAG TPA: Uma2 family endonuclease [Leptospiraceae bacterium]|nr:Uma2 family endonuclease [Leptospiraceae bacterium]HMW07793.1 Uma2 family endonuclease [Leptospiraceae bacterium]HMX35398.1 Uma2 family endonuclease [Leptospiraceae bacterium]HMY34163.1 Uma2 family endonuclease [Leptospiraceae bacterium]HMZ64064.1 Uma2 family endonuclease [Leptospiraceae bacterium]